MKSARGWTTHREDRPEDSRSANPPSARCRLARRHSYRRRRCCGWLNRSSRASAAGCAEVPICRLDSARNGARAPRLESRQEVHRRACRPDRSPPLPKVLAEVLRCRNRSAGTDAWVRTACSRTAAWEGMYRAGSRPFLNIHETSPTRAARVSQRDTPCTSARRSETAAQLPRAADTRCFSRASPSQ